jgi:hypothetical protein
MNRSEQLVPLLTGAGRVERIDALLERVAKLERALEQIVNSSMTVEQARYIAQEALSD